MVRLFKNDRGISLLEVAVSCAVIGLSLAVALGSYKANMQQYQSLKLKQAINPIEDDLKGAGLKIATDFLRRINTDASGNKITSSAFCQVNYANHSFLTDTSRAVRMASGSSLLLLDRSRMTVAGTRFILPNYQPESSKFLAAKARCEDAQTAYETNHAPVADLRSKKGLYWCMEVANSSGTDPQDSAGAIATMNAIVEFMFTPINIQTGQQLTCSEYAAQRDFSKPQDDLIIGLLYYSVYWANKNAEGKLVTADHTGFFASGGS